MKCKFTQILSLSLIFSLGAVAQALAAGERYDNSSVFVWSFLSLCALIALAQLLPTVGKMISRATEMKGEKKVQLGTSSTRHGAA